MKRSLICTLISLLAVTGCANQHVDNEKAALARWNVARAQLTVDLGQKQFLSGNINKALLTASDAVEIKPDYIPAWLLLGKISLEQNKLKQARECFVKCLDLNPISGEANYYMGIVYEQLGRPDEAYSFYENAFSADPDNVPYFLAMAEVLIGQGKLAAAAELLNGRISGGTYDASVYLLAGEVFTLQKDHSRAVVMFRKALAMSPGDLLATESLAFALHRAGRPKDALVLLEKLTRDDRHQDKQESWSYQFGMGDCYMSLGQYHKAKRCFEYVTDRNPTEPAVWLRLAQVSLQQDDFDRANFYAEKVLALQADNTDAMMVVGYVAIEREDFQKAQSAWRAITAIDRGNGLAYCMLGRSLQSLGETEQAVQSYRRALQINPHDVMARKALGSIAAPAIGSAQKVRTF